MKHIIAIALLAFTASAFAQATHPLLTTQEECDLSNAVSSLDAGCSKVIDGKPQTVPYTFSGAVRFALAIDAGLVKPKLDAYLVASASVRARLDPERYERQPRGRCDQP